MGISGGVEAVATVLLRHTLATLALAFVRSHWQRVAIWGLFLSMDWHAYKILCAWERDDVAVFMLAVFIFGPTVIYTYVLALTPDPRAAFQFRNEPPPQTTMQQLYWAIRVQCRTRMVGTVSQARGIPPPSTKSPRAFVQERLGLIARDGILTGFLWTLVVAFNLAGFLHPADPQRLSWRFMVGRICCTALCTYTASFGLALPYDLLSIVAVATGISQPSDWPAFFGTIWDATSVTKCWNFVWHQTFRNAFSAFGDLITSVLRIRPGSALHKTVKGLAAFGMSALMHSAGDYAMFQGRFWFSPQFFIVQPIAIAAETAVIGAAKALGFTQRFRKVASAIGYIWVIVWMSLTFPSFAHPLWEVSLLDWGRDVFYRCCPRV